MSTHCELERVSAAPEEAPARRRAEVSAAAVPQSRTEPDNSTPFRGKRASLAAGISVNAALEALLQTGLAHFLGNRAAVLAGDPEGVHQMRVGLRRLRSTLSTFKPAVAQEALSPLLGEARVLFSDLGTIREADVFLLETLKEAEADGLPGRAASGTRKAVEAYRAQRFAQLASHLASTDFDRFAHDLSEWIERGGWRDDSQPALVARQSMRIEAFLGPRLDRAWRRVLGKAKKAMKGSLADWHEVRIAVKRVRYVSEHLPDVYGGSAAKFARKLQRLQEDLGHLNDLATLDSVLDRAKAEAGARLRPSVRDTRLFLSGWRAGQEKALLLALRADGKRLRRSDAFW